MADKKILTVGRPNIGNINKFIDYTKDIFQSQWLTNNGKYLKMFEEKLKDFLNVRNVIAVTNGTTGLQIAIKALNMNGEIIVPSYTFVATVHSLHWLGIVPVFCDINTDTYNIDADKIEMLINSNTTGILPVHVYGRPVEINKIDDIAKKYNLNVLYDAAHAIGNTYKGKMVGNFGDVEVFSFHATKIFNTFEGGAICTNNDELADKMRAMRNFGFINNGVSSYVGINGKMPEISAAMGIVNFDDFEYFRNINRENYLYYKNKISKINGIKLIEYNENELNNYQYIIIEINEKTTGVNRDELFNFLIQNNIYVKKYFYPPCHKMEPYNNLYKVVNLPNTDLVSSRVLSLPTGSSVSSNDIDLIISFIKKFLDNKEANNNH